MYVLMKNIIINNSLFLYAAKLVNKCTSTHLNANVSLDSNANTNVFGPHSNENVLVTHLQMHLN